MQITRNQHYIPRFYMKPFSVIKNEGTKKEKALISFYQFKDNLFRKNVPTASICSEKYFYDQDGKIENNLAKKESEWGRIISKLNCDKQLTKKEISSVREFAIYQIIRTKATLLHNQAMAMSMLTGILYEQNDGANRRTVEEVVKENVKEKITPEYNLDLVNDILPIIADLEMSVLKNKTDTYFITSDVPVIVINPLRIHGAGLSDIGIVIFFPISQQNLILLYDSKFYGKINEEIENCDIVNSFNKYQYIGADERVLAMDSSELYDYTQDEELNNLRDKFYNIAKTKTIDDGQGVFMATRSRSMEYYINIPIFKLPKSLRKIPRDYRETFSRKYDPETRDAILLRIYNKPDLHDKQLENHWKSSSQYTKILLGYLDYYWKTPKEDMVISGELMHRLKTAKGKLFPI